MASEERPEAEAGGVEGERKPARSLAEVEAEIARTEAELAECRGTECEVYARIVGYYRSVKNWNRGKREEFGERRPFREDAEAVARHLAEGGGFPCGNEAAPMARMEKEAAHEA